MKNQSLLMGLYALTSIAPGTGQNLGAVDLPIMREAPTGYPVIFGSALKGAMRAKAEEIDKDLAKEIFGDDDAGGSKFSGSVLVGDAKILLLPVRSMTTHFKWVTCPYLIARFNRDSAMGGQPANISVPKINAFDDALVATESGDLYLEEFLLKSKTTDLSSLIEKLNHLMGGDQAERLKEGLIVVSDDLFAHLSQFATPVNAHIAIDSNSKIVIKGALWYEETLPPETLLYSLLMIHASRKPTSTTLELPSKVEAQVRAIFKDYLQVGGNETVGMGWVKTTLIGATHG
ncbi:MAG: type III-B CRISPR module RAMP protein Cmr4 [Campylobacterales bacterium]